MSSIGGEKRVENNFKKHVGLFEAKVVAINPTVEDYKQLWNVELKEDDKTTEYLTVNDNGNDCLRIDVHLQHVKAQENGTHLRFKVVFFLENKERENKDMTKKQYINSVGSCTWADSPNFLKEWFTGDAKSPRDYRVAFSGEEELYTFLRSWLSKLEYKAASTTLDVDNNWKKFMRGNVSPIKEQIDGEWCDTIVALATVRTKEKEGKVEEYQSVYNKMFLGAYSLANFRLVDYSDSKVQESLKTKDPKTLKYHEKFVLNMIGEYGCKDYFILKDLREYNPEENLVASDKTISEGGDDY